jgi:hypothetical protein
LGRTEAPFPVRDFDQALAPRGSDPLDFIDLVDKVGGRVAEYFHAQLRVFQDWFLRSFPSGIEISEAINRHRLKDSRMKKVIVTTTINPPTKAIELFDSLEGWQLVVIGDLKTPKDYALKRGIYVSPAEQESYDGALSAAIGWSCIQRRNFGLLWAADMGADIVAVIDDDNIPFEHWGKDLMVGREVSVNFYETDLPAFDPVGATNERQLWHRGYPLQLLSRRDYSRVVSKTMVPD